jgi:micrococcal nuclease
MRTHKENWLISWVKKHPIWTVIIILVFIGLIVGSSPEENSSATNLEEGISDLTGNPILNQNESSLPQTEDSSKDNLFKVTNVIDGDTIYIDTGEKVRLICIDTSESGEAGYQEAKEFLQDLILYKEVKLTKDVSETDKYGRLLRYIYTKDGAFVNELIALEGYGRAYPYPPDTALCSKIIEAENIAKSQKIGIWAGEEIEYEEGPSKSDTEYVCDSNIYNCDDFITHAEAQAVFKACGGSSNDIHRLDGDNDGLACESLP